MAEEGHEGISLVRRVGRQHVLRRHLRDAAVNEVSVLRPRLTPAEPGASVVLLERSSPPAVSSDLAAGEEIIHMGGRPIVRYFDNAVIEVR